MSDGEDARTEALRAKRARYEEKRKSEPDRLAKRRAQQREHYQRARAAKLAEIAAAGPEAIAAAKEKRRLQERENTISKRMRANPGMTREEAVEVGRKFQAEKERRDAERRQFRDETQTTGRRPDETRYEYRLRLNREGAARRLADPERRDQQIAMRKAREERRRQTLVRKPLTPEQYAKVLNAQRLRRGNAIRPIGTQRVIQPSRPTGSVVVTAAPSLWRDMLAEISRLAPRLDEREDIIAEAALLAVQGMDVAAAVAQAKRTVSREADPYRYMKPIEDCFWL